MLIDLRSLSCPVCPKFSGTKRIGLTVGRLTRSIEADQRRFVVRIAHIPLRVATGAFILNSGLGKRNLPDENAEALQGMAAQAFPFVKQWRPTTFGTALSTAEIGIGAALLSPIVPSFLAGAALAAFGGGMVTMYWKTPGMHEEGDPRPTQDGLALAKDVWMLGGGLTLMLDGLRKH